MIRSLSRMVGTSIRSQLLFWLLCPLLIIGLLAIYDSNRSARDTADAVSDRVLSGSVLAIAEQVFVNEDNNLEVDIPYVALQMLTSLEDDRVFYKIESADGAFVTGYRELTLPAKALDSSEISFHDGNFRGDAIRIAVFDGVTASSEKSIGFRVAVAETTNGRNSVAAAILLRSVVSQAIILIAVAILIWIVVSRALRPLKRLEQAVNRRSPDDLRPIEHLVPSEVQGLVQTINQLLDRFSSAISALQAFTSNASHQFRTPLALIKTHLEIAAREQDPANKQRAMDSANKAVSEAERLMAQMLLLARLDTSKKEELRSKTCNLTQLTREVCEEFILQLSHRSRRDVDLGFDAQQTVIVLADPTLAQEVIRNLVDNAIKHSGADPKIDVVVDQSAGYGRVTILDQGTGFSPSLLQQPQTRADRMESSGLGLSIVREITTLLNGTLKAERLEPSGMKVAASFRLIPSALSD